jgi:hypothetical protein
MSAPISALNTDCKELLAWRTYPDTPIERTGFTAA